MNFRFNPRRPLSVLCAVLVFLLGIGNAPAFDPEEDEEPAGGSFAFLLNPQDDIYGVSLGSGAWIKGTPVFGDGFASLFDNGIEDALYSGIGMSIRIMPHWTVAPFVGVGGSYNHSMSGEYEPGTAAEQGELASRGASYWGGHVEAGVRVWLHNGMRLLELMARQTFSSLEGERDYWLIGLSMRPGL